MVLVRRLGGWRPVEATEGVGSLRYRNGKSITDVHYRFEVWHQFAQGFHGPYRSEGSVTGLAPVDLATLVGQDVLLELADGRFLPSRVGPDSTLLAHGGPSEVDPWADGES